MKKDMKMNGMKEMSGMNLMKAIGPMIRPGMKSIGPMKICATLMSMEISREKEKEIEKERKGKKGKDDDGKGGKPEMNYVQPQTSSTPAMQNQQQQQAHYSSAASSSGRWHG